MFELVIAIGTLVLSNVLQIAIGCILSVFICLFDREKVKSRLEKSSAIYFCIITAAVCGLALPLGTYGVIPIIAALFAVGFKDYVMVPLVFSNSLFNMLVPYNDPSFVWRTGVKRLVLALIVSILSGLIVRKFMVKDTNLFRIRTLEAVIQRPAGIKAAFSAFGNSINLFGVYLILGAGLDSIFHRYALPDFMNFMFTNPNTSSIPQFFSSLNVANPLFLLAMNIISMLMDLTKISALLVIFKVRGFIYFVSIFLTCTVLLSISAFIK